MRRVISLKDLEGGPVQATDRSRDLLGDQRSRHHPEEEDHRGQCGEVKDRVPHRVVDGRDALSHTHGADGATAVQDRHGRGEDFCPEGRAVPGDLRRPPVEGPAHLRAVRIFAAGPRPGGVGEQATGRVDDDHPTADALG
jgi:hypothetical protein